MEMNSKMPSKKKSESKKKEPCWKQEKKRDEPRIDKLGQIVGTGSWYMRRPYNYSLVEVSKKQGDKDRVRTVDCHHTDQIRRRKLRDDSEEPSDWKERTSLSMGEWRKREKQERELFRGEMEERKRARK